MEEITVGEHPEGAAVPSEPAPPIHSRFLFVDVAALRAKQLRRGARLRIEGAPEVELPRKPERLAMEEVRRGLVSYEVPRKASGKGMYRWNSKRPGRKRAGSRISTKLVVPTTNTSSSRWKPSISVSSWLTIECSTPEPV